MTKPPAVATLLAVAALAVTPALAQTLSAADQADGRCVAAMMAMSEKSKGSDKAAFDSSMMYFLGKLAGRSGKTAVGPAIGAAAVSVTEANAATTAERCATEIEATTNAM